jgi:hypothetical protein
LTCVAPSGFFLLCPALFICEVWFCFIKNLEENQCTFVPLSCDTQIWNFIHCFIFALSST